VLILSRGALPLLMEMNQVIDYAPSIQKAMYKFGMGIYDCQEMVLPNRNYRNIVCS